MRIEETTEINLSKDSDKNLLILKLRFTQLWDKVFKNNSTAVVGSLNRGAFLKKYHLLLKEMDSRKIEKSTSDIDKASFKKAMVIKKFGIDVSDLSEIVLSPNYISIDAAGVSIEKLDEIVNALKVGLIEGVSDPVAPDAAYIPLYDLVLKAKPDTTVVEISKPYPNEHSARLQDPDKFDSKSFRRTKGGLVYGSKKIPTTISIIWGKLKNKAKPADPPVAQALRFPVKDWTVTKAKKWLTDNEIKYKVFESAIRKTKKMWSKKYIEKLPDNAFLYIGKHNEEDNVRFFPYIDNTSTVDMTRLKMTISNISKSDLPETVKEEVQAKAEQIYNDTLEGKQFEKYVSVYPIDKADSEEHIVCGIVYEPDVEDSQGDMADEEEIRKAAYRFMEKTQTFKVMHKNQKVKVKVLESYIAPTDFTLAFQTIKKGSWVITVRVLDKKIWKSVKSGELNGFSMAGYATSE